MRIQEIKTHIDLAQEIINKDFPKLIKEICDELQVSYLSRYVDWDKYRGWEVEQDFFEIKDLKELELTMFNKMSNRFWIEGSDQDKWDKFKEMLEEFEYLFELPHISYCHINKQFYKSSWEGTTREAKEIEIDTSVVEDTKEVVYQIWYDEWVDSGTMAKLARTESGIIEVVKADKVLLAGRSIVDILVDFDKLEVNYTYKDWSGDIEEAVLYLHKLELI